MAALRARGAASVDGLRDRPLPGRKVSASPWDGLPRWPLRAVLAAVCAVDIASMGGVLSRTLPGAIAHPMAPAFLLALGGSPALLVPPGLIGLGALVLFARRRAPIAAGLTALAVLVLFGEACSALEGGPARNWFLSGAMLLGWIFGLAFARWLRPGKGGDCSDEQLAELGAAAAIAAAYVGAGSSKLLVSGLAWADTTTLRAVILSHHDLSRPGLVGAWVRIVVENPPLSRIFSVATVAIQLGAFLYLLHPRLRMLWGTLLLAFHVNVYLLTGIGYAEAFWLILLFSYPWPRWVRLLLRRPPPPATTPTPAPSPADRARARTVALRAAALIALLALCAWLLPLGEYAALQHRPGVGWRAITSLTCPRV